jgi:hypothetical protein
MGNQERQTDTTSATQTESIMAVGVAQRLVWGVIASAVPLFCWRWVEGAWPGWWYWVVCLIIGLFVTWVSRVAIVLWRHARLLSYIESPAFALQHGGIWTEIQHVQGGGAKQVMRMEDGNFVLLSVGITTVIVFVTPKLGDQTHMIDLASFQAKDPLERTQLAREDRRPEDERMLNHLRTAIGFPKSSEELRRTLQTLGPSLFGYQGYPKGYKAGTEWAENKAKAAELTRLQSFQESMKSRSQGDWEQWFCHQSQKLPWLDLVRVIQDDKILCAPAVAIEFWHATLGATSQQAANGDFLRGFAEGAVDLWAKVQKQV